MKRILLCLMGAVLLLCLSSCEKVQPKAMPEAEGLDSISVSVEPDTEEHRLWVTQTMRLVNRTGETQSTVHFRAYANSFASAETSPVCYETEMFSRCCPDGFSSGAFALRRAYVNGENIVSYFADEAQTELVLPVPHGWQDGAEIEVRVDYAVQIPQIAYRFGVTDGVYTLSDCFLIPSSCDETYPPFGQVPLGERFNWTVEVRLPKGYACYGNGQTVCEGETWRVNAYAARSVALLIGKNLHVVQARVGETQLICVADSRANASKLSKAAKKAFALYAERYGKLDYPAVTVALSPMALTSSTSDGMGLIGKSAFEGDEQSAEYAVARVVALQWWNASVDTDTYFQPWLSEALAGYATLQYAADRYGNARREELIGLWALSAMRISNTEGATAGAPLYAFSSESEYENIVKGRGLAALCVLDELCSGKLDEVLAALYRRYAFSSLTREDFEAVYADVTGLDPAPLLRDYLDTELLF